MKTNKILVALLATGALAAATGVYASSDGGKDDEAREIDAVMTAPVSLAQAIATAEKESQGRTLEAGAEEEDGRVLYEVTTLADGKIYEFMIDPQSGAVLDREVEEAEQDDLVTGNVVEILNAMAAAETASNGTAIEAELEMEDGQAVYEVEVASGDVLTTVLVDAMSGQVIALDDENHDENHDEDHDDDHDDD
jgi:uncharacterized membrane protein YkoI